MSNHDDSAVGATIKRYRETQGLSQAQLAEEMANYGLEGIYPQTIAKIEAGNRGVKFSEGIVMAQVLGVEPGAFFNPTKLDDALIKAAQLQRLLQSAEERRLQARLTVDAADAAASALRAQLEDQRRVIEALRADVQS